MKHVIPALLFASCTLLFPSAGHGYPSLPALLRFVSAQGTNPYEERLREAELAGNREQASAICREWYASGQYSPGMLNWNYNALMSVEENGLLFTARESDTYPALLLQYALDVRSDVTVLSLQLLENQNYRDWIARKRPFPWIPSGTGFGEFVERILHENHQAGWQYFPAYFGVMSDKALLRADREKLYLTGLALRFSAKPFDNIAVLRYNFENCFRTDYLALPLGPENQAETVAQLNLNYIPSLLLLHRHYSAAGEADKAQRVQDLALKIARAGNREAEVSAYFYPASSAAITSAFTPKLLERPMKKITSRLYASESELSNELYDLFLQDLVKNKEFDQLILCRTTKTDWRALLPDSLRQKPDAALFEHGTPDGPNYPVQNISHEAAQRFCAWITLAYNSSSTKRKFKKVLFRLPTQSEWELAASGGLQNALYPWGGLYVRNAKGCYLLNLHAVEPCGDCLLPKEAAGEDGGYFPVMVDTYFPNNFGLYNASGNVAEMLLEPGICKGGSWNDAPIWCQIKTNKTYNEPSPTIGFRVFMEVIEE